MGEHTTGSSSSTIGLCQGVARCLAANDQLEAAIEDLKALIGRNRVLLETSRGLVLVTEDYDYDLQCRALTVKGKRCRNCVFGEQFYGWPYEWPVAVMERYPEQQLFNQMCRTHLGQEPGDFPVDWVLL